MINKPRAGSLSLAQNDVPLQNAFPTPDGPPRQPRTPGGNGLWPGFRHPPLECRPRGLERDPAPLPEAVRPARALAGRQHARAVYPAVVSDLPQPRDLLVAHSPAGRPRRRVPREGVHHFPRLRARILFQIQNGQRRPGLCHRHPDLHALPSLEVGAFHSPRQRGPPRQARHRRRLDNDGAGVSGVVGLDAIHVSIGAQSHCALPAGAAFFVSHPASVFVKEGQQAGTLVGLLDEPGDCRHGCRHDRGVRPAAVPDHSVGDRRRCRLGGIWLFYVQHQFEGVYWERGDQWDYTAAALQGSSFYKLPKILQWFSGNIGFRHIHHLSARIPNYNLERCHRAHPLFQSVKSITLGSSLKSFTFRLWDEQNRRLVGFGPLREMRRAARS